MFTRDIKGPVPLSSCEFSIHPIRLQPSEIFTYYERLRSYVQHEDGLINSRLTWSLTIHGFLFTIYGILTGKYVDILMSAKPSVSMVSVLLIVQIIASLVGVFVGYYSREAIVAAHIALQHLFTIAHSQGIFEISTGPITSLTPLPIILPKIVSGGAPTTKTLGASRYYVRLPLFLMAVWILLACLSAYVLLLLHHNPQRLLH